jgi:hypothetical protein
MCFSMNTIEHQAYHYTEQMNTSSLYKIVHIHMIGHSVHIEKGPPLEAQLDFGGQLPLIKIVTLVDGTGKNYAVEPNEFGVRFAHGEMTYQQYLKTRKKEVTKLLAYSLGSAGIFITAAGAFIGYFL